MYNDLSKCEIGELLATVKNGWVKLKYYHPQNVDYPVILSNLETYTQFGMYDKRDMFPTVFTRMDCPQWLIDIIGIPLKKGDKVLCKGERRYFSHESNGFCYCFINGYDEWASYGEVTEWHKKDIEIYIPGQ